MEHITARLARQVGHEEQNYVGFLVEYDCGRNHRVEYVLDGQASEPALGSTLMQAKRREFEIRSFRRRSAMFWLVGMILGGIIGWNMHFMLGINPL